MNRNPLRPISRNEIESYERDGVVWPMAILDPEWLAGLQSAIADLVANQRGEAVDFTNVGLATLSPEPSFRF